MYIKEVEIIFAVFPSVGTRFNKLSRQLQRKSNISLFKREKAALKLSLLWEKTQQET